MGFRLTSRSTPIKVPLIPTGLVGRFDLEAQRLIKGPDALVELGGEWAVLACRFDECRPDSPGATTTHYGDRRDVSHVRSRLEDDDADDPAVYGCDEYVARLDPIVDPLDSEHGGIEQGADSESIVVLGGSEIEFHVATFDRSGFGRFDHARYSISEKAFTDRPTIATHATREDSAGPDRRADRRGR